MKIISSAVLVALFATSQARFLDATNSAVPVTTTYPGVSFSDSLNCGACIGSGYTYCNNGPENKTDTSYRYGNGDQKCYRSTDNKDKENDNNWSCSSAFSDRVYSKFVCQNNENACGKVRDVTLATVNSTATVSVTSLSNGQTCFYKVTSLCGAPAFKPTDTSRVEVEYVEFRNSAVNVTGTDIVKG